MAKRSDKDIQNMSVDWACDPTSGNIPFSGASVQRFIKKEISERAAAGSFIAGDKMKLYLFGTVEDKYEFDEDPSKEYLAIATIPINFENTQYRIKVTPDDDTTINATINQQTVDIGMALQVEKRELGEPTWESVGYDIGVKVYVDANNTGTYVEIPKLAQVVLSSVGRLTVDIKPYIPTGTSRIRFYFYAIEDESITASILYNVTLAEMYLEAWENNLMWNRALIEDEQTTDYSLGGFRIVGNIAKTIHISVSTASTVVAYFSRDIGSYEAIENAYFFTRDDGLDLANPVDDEGESLPALTTGIYTVRVWLTSGSLTTEDNAVTYSVMYVASGEQYTARLVVMNNSGRMVNNYDEAAHLCDYAVYNAGETYGNVTILITPYQAGTPQKSTTIETRVASEVLQSLNHNINLVTNSQLLSVRYRITLENGNYEEDNSTVDNRDIFPAETGASFYLNTSLRGNGEETKEVIYNTAGSETIALDPVTWEKMSWVNGMDGWTEDDEGRKCLMLPARSKLIIPVSSYQFLTGENVTFEFSYKVKNVSDYSDNVIAIAQNPEQESFMGIRIKPTNITVHSGADMSSENDIYQGTNLSDEETVHVLITVQNSFGGNSGKNLVTGYINGIKGFQFSYANGTLWANSNANAIFGSDSADLYLYMVRVYNSRALSSAGAENNWLNSLVTRDEKVAYKEFITSILRSGSRQIDYEEVKNSGKYNFFVLEMTSGAGIPSKSYPDGGRGNLEMHYGDDANGNPRFAWDWKIYDVETQGQGTTSMNYWLWNIRWRIDKTDSSKKRLVSYYDTPTMVGKVRTFNELTPTSSKTVWFDGEDNHPAVKRITAKINFASSMQSHKMGATSAYNVLHNELENGALLNEAQAYAAMHELPSPTVAVYQYPAFGFQKIVDSLGNETYSFIGLFTIGPDKGDKPTFGFDLVEDDLVSMEGVDHTPQMAKFNVPWDEQTVYAVNAKGDGFLATKGPGGNAVNAFEVGNAKNADTSSSNSAMPVLVSTFKNAYDVIYNNSTLIAPVALEDDGYGAETAAGVLANINADTENFRKRAFNNRISFTDAEFWIEGEYKLYHFEYESGKFVSGYKQSGAYGSPVDLRVDTGITDSELSGLTLEQQNDLFKQARRARFVSNAPTYWDMSELIYNYVFLVMSCATDNFAKNQYLIYMGGKWRFRQDDLDTIIDIDNNGGQTKPSDIEFGDDRDGSPYFAGSNSVLWNLVHESLWSDFTVGGITYSGIKTIGREMIELMSLKAGGTNTYDGFIKFFDKYFWKNAQEYFPQSAYNIDGNIKYEAAWLAGTQAVDPLRQSLGSHYLAEYLWVRRRAVYCMSLFGVGTFSYNMDTSLNSIKFRPINLGKMEITVAESMYPSLILGAGDIRPTARTLSGDTCEFGNLNSDGNTVYTLQAVDYITSLGDLKALKLGNDDGGTFNVTGKKLRTIKLGDADDSAVDTNVVTLNIGTDGLPCLEVVDVRNAASLSSPLDLTKCKRVKEVYAEGTSIASVVLPRGSKIEKLHLPENVTTLSYQVIKYLSDLVLPEDPSNITLVYLEECDALDGMETLESVFNADGQNLQFIRLLWNTEHDATGSQIRMLSYIAQNKEKDGSTHSGGYHGVSSTGAGDASNPHLEGRLVAAAYYQSDIETLAGSGVTPSDSTVHPGMKEIQAPYFGPLYIAFNLSDRYIDFVDKNVESALAEEFGDGTGVTVSEAPEVTSLGGIFQGSSITSFDEMQYFTGLATLETSNTSQGQFYNCTSLQSITVPQIGDPSNNANCFRGAFSGCSSLEELTWNGIISGGASNMFTGCTSLTRINAVSLQSWLQNSWSRNDYAAPFSASSGGHIYINGDELTSLELSSPITTVGVAAFYNVKGLTSLTITNSIESIRKYAFYGCSNIAGTLDVPSSVVTIGSGAFNECSLITNINIYRSIGSVDTACFYHAGDSTGKFISNCGITQNSASNLRFKEIIVHGDYIRNASYYLTQSSELKCIRIRGNVTWSGRDSLYNTYGEVSQLFEFCEILGNVSFSSDSSCTLLHVTAYQACINGFIFHFGYNHKISVTPAQCMPNSSVAQRVAKIYVGSGVSQAADEAVLAEYLTDDSTGGWAEYADKLDIWYNYIYNEPTAKEEYKTFPSMLVES